MYNDLEQVTDALLVTSRALMSVSARSLADVEDVTLPQYRALVVVASLDRVTVRTLAGRMDIHASTATRLCDRLVRKSLIRRTAGRTDRREIEIELTAKGRRLVERVTVRRRGYLAEVAERMTPAQRRSAIAALKAFAEAAGEQHEASLFGWPPPSTPGAEGMSR